MATEWWMMMGWRSQLSNNKNFRWKRRRNFSMHETLGPMSGFPGRKQWKIIPSMVRTLPHYYFSIRFNWKRMVELRKRKVPHQHPIPEKKSKKEQAPSTASKPPQSQETDNNTTGVPNVGDTIVLEGFGGGIETNEGSKTTLKEIVNASQSGVVLFTYPKASTPGCKFT